MNGLTQTQADMLGAIRRLSQGGVSPSFDELKAELGLASKSTVHRTLQKLRERGVVDFRAGTARSVRVIGELEGLERRPSADLRALRDRIDVILKGRAQ